MANSSDSKALLFDSDCESILDSADLKEFIALNLNRPVDELRLRESKKKHSFDLEFALTQIGCRRKCSRKLPSYLNFPDFYFPSDIASQQASHEEVARLHSYIIGSGKQVLDLTAGLGIDAMEAARNGNRVTALEIDAWKCDTLRHNAETIGVNDLTPICADASTYIYEEVEENEFDLVFIDPARRAADSRRTHAFADCSPDILKLMPRLLQIAERVLIKASPLLDITQVLRELPETHAIYAVAWHGECKEILVEVRRPRENQGSNDSSEGAHPGNPILKGVNILQGFQLESFATHFSEPELPDSLTKSNPSSADMIIREGGWLLEPNAAIMKLGCWEQIAGRWPELVKADPNTHIFLSEKPIEGFPGRQTEIVGEVLKKDRRKLKGERMSVVCRNYPVQAAELRKEMGLKEGDSRFIYGIRVGGKPRLIQTVAKNLELHLKNHKMVTTLSQTNFEFKGERSLYHGKVRDVYDIDDRYLVMVATDRISAFDVVLPEGIPYKGQVLNQIAAWFLDATSDIVPNWKVAVPDPMATIGVKCQPLKIEMIVRGYLAGSAWRDYAAGKREICGVKLPEGLRENEKLPHPILTPTTKADAGHDENISREEILARGIAGKDVYEQVERYALALFERGQKMAAERGLILVDTKYEFGLHDGKVILIDEIHTPDSSRYFYAEGYEERFAKGEPQRQLSKEFVRQWLIERGFTGQAGQQVPEMTPEFCREVSDRYIELYEKMTGETFVKGSTDNLADRISTNIADALAKL